ncbi:cobalt ECF transporter T component CbiQ [Desulfosediminicola sp.]|uniref:cobalt ECF transporter T component CbiQ n=1 Tax=Desulfosediminicola sp. TaxID=2886825 RepID=UPI003AF2544C
MIFEQFSQGNSLLHRTDTRVKLVSATALTLVLALTKSYQVASYGLVLATLLVFMARLNLKSVLLRLAVVNSFTIFLWLTLPLTYPGQAIATLGPLGISGAGVHMALLITLKTNGIVLLCIALLATSNIADIGHSLNRLHFPEKLCLLLLFSYRYVFLIHQEFQRLVRAARLRCFRPATNMHTYRTYGYLFGMTLVNSWHRAERVNQAMTLRGFHGRFYSLNEKSCSRSDLVFVVAMIFVAAGLGSFELLVL